MPIAVSRVVARLWSHRAALRDMARWIPCIRLRRGRVLVWGRALRQGGKHVTQVAGMSMQCESQIILERSVTQHSARKRLSRGTEVRASRLSEW
jgi:hypothetical protein